MRKLQITEGKVYVSTRRDQDGDDVFLIENEDWNICTTFTYSDQDEANAQLIADAFNTANKCDMLPSELLEQRDELLKLLKSVYLKNQQLSNASVSFAVHTDNERAMMRNFISKCFNIDALDLQIEIETSAIEHKIEL